MKYIGCFSEMKLSFADNGSISNYISATRNYNLNSVINYLKSNKKVASCPKPAIDCFTGKEISPSFTVYSDGVYTWCDFLIYHLEKYHLSLEEDFINHITKNIA